MKLIEKIKMLLSQAKLINAYCQLETTHKNLVKQVQRCDIESGFDFSKTYRLGFEEGLAACQEKMRKMMEGGE